MEPSHRHDGIITKFWHQEQSTLHTTLSCVVTLNGSLTIRTLANGTSVGYSIWNATTASSVEQGCCVEEHEAQLMGSCLVDQFTIDCNAIGLSICRTFWYRRCFTVIRLVFEYRFSRLFPILEAGHVRTFRSTREPLRTKRRNLLPGI